MVNVKEEQQGAVESSKNLAFIKAVATYFMDFLETDFHRAKKPKRSFKVHNDDNLLVGLNLNKYKSFNSLIWKEINKAFETHPLKVGKGVYNTNLPENVSDYIGLQVSKLSDKGIKQAVSEISEQVGSLAVLHKKEFDKAISTANEEAAKIIKKELVLDFIHSIEKPLENLNLSDENSIYLMEEELTEILLKPLLEIISRNIKLITRGEKSNISKELTKELTLSEVKNSIATFFENFKIADIFSELLEMDRNRNILDKQDFYLYFCDITYKKNKYPIFYLPFSFEKTAGSVDINFEPQVYINKKALEFVSQQFNLETGKKGSLDKISERIIYLSQHKDDFREIIQSILSELVDFFGLDKSIKITSSDSQVSKSFYASISNNCSIALFDKSDEALVNDYEDILNLEDDSELVVAFNKLIDDFIHNNPVRCSLEIAEEWDELPTSDKLVFQSPIPLNSEQIQILKAVEREDCKYIIVEGPPGTGKSHTITAVVCNAILNNKSVLVLSDKKEALDVVEDKIVGTIQSVRMDNKFQNPVLRIGKIGNNFGKILSTASIGETTQYYRATKKNYEKLTSDINKSLNSLKDDIDAEISTYDEIKIKEIQEYYGLESSLDDIFALFDADEMRINNNCAIEFEDIRKITIKLQEVLGEDKRVSLDSLKDEDADDIKNLEAINIYYGDLELLKRDDKDDTLKKYFGTVAGVNLNEAQELMVVHKTLSDRFTSNEHVKNIYPKNEGKYVDQFKCFLKDYFAVNQIIDTVKTVYGNKIKSLDLIIDINEGDIEKISAFVNKFESLKKGFLGFLLSKKEAEKIDLEFRKSFPHSKVEDAHKNLEELKSVVDILNYINEQKSQLSQEFQSRNKYLPALVNLIQNADEAFSDFIETSAMIESVNKLEESLSEKEWFKKADIKEFSQMSAPIEAQKVIDAAKNLLTYSTSLNHYLKDQSDELKYEKIWALDFKNLVSENSERIETIKKVIEINDDIQYLSKIIDNYPVTLGKVSALDTNGEYIFKNKLTTMPDSDFDNLVRYLLLKQKLAKEFNDIPLIKYGNQKINIEKMTTIQMTYLMDERLVEFHDKNSASLKALKNIITSKQRFPKESFTKLKEAFPCILAGIRDYAEYIPLEPNLFDLVIIDEASQVSVSQAFPALLRANKVLILGDKKQFSNVKSNQAKTDINNECINELEDVFKKNVSRGTEELVRLKKFNIKTSILEFFEFISNYNIQLLKHFRGYKEIISYSNKYFYNDTLQVMKIRGKSVDEVLKFGFVEHDGKAELIPNTNMLEIKYIASELRKLKEAGCKQSVGVITPHTNQQSLIFTELNKLPEKDYYFDDLRLKVMTFDTCQGEERDIIFYSMVATENDDKLNHIFPTDLSAVKMDDDEEGNLRAQRLNVGFSRAKETVHMVLSKDIDKFTGSIGDVIRHFWNTLEEAKLEKSTDEVDKNSPMEKEVLNWFYQTNFWKENKDSIEFIPQFEIGKYLKQLDRTYNHANYKVDFLLVYKDDLSISHKIIIEYDGFKEHFKDPESVRSFNYEQYYNDGDVYREKVLESYGYKFLRINKFNIGVNPIGQLDIRLDKLIRDTYGDNNIIDDIHETVAGLQNGNKKECPNCKEIRDIADFKDASLVSGMGRFCNKCKKTQSGSRPKTRVSDSTVCPQCGSAMALREGRYGKFYGCSRYPYCRGTRQYMGKLQN